MFNTILIIISVLLATSILLQQRGAGASGGIFGGGSGGFENSFQAKRGFDKILFISTIILAILFIGVAFARLLMF